MMEFHRAYRYRLYPTPEQRALLCQNAGAVRFVYNLALEQRRDWWRQYRANGISLSLASQSKELTQLRAEVDWLAAAPRTFLDQALRDLDKAFAAFFAGRSGYPTNRTRDRNSAFCVKRIESRITPLNRKWAALHIPKCSPIKMRLSRPISGDIRNMTIREVGGLWFVAIVTKITVEVNGPHRPIIGMDRGVTNTLSLSNGEHHSVPDMSRVVIARTRAQRSLARCKRGSRRRQKAKHRAARYSARIAASRNHWLHERSTDIARRFGTVIMEALKVSNMTAGGRGKRGLNRSILAQGWSTFATMLEYKVTERGGRVEYVNPAYTSQTCAECGFIDKRSRESQASFRCVDCGHTAHADTNAALNILRRSPAGVEVAGCGAVEARIMLPATVAQTSRQSWGKAEMPSDAGITRTAIEGGKP